MTDSRMDAKSAGYMELQGAKKDADCRKVSVPGGVSQIRGCCNEFKPDRGSRYFNCGTCHFVKKEASGLGKTKYRAYTWEELRHFRSATLEAINV